MGSLCALCFVTTLIEKFDQPKYRPFRGIMFVCLGLSTCAIFKPDKSEDHLQTPVLWYAIGGYIYIQGAVLYVMRVPERCKPGSFDLCGASH
jgi:adiponectin receptor